MGEAALLLESGATLIVEGALVRFDLQTLSGEITSEIPVEDSAPSGATADRLRLTARTTSGDIRITRALELGDDRLVP